MKKRSKGDKEARQALWVQYQNIRTNPGALFTVIDHFTSITRCNTTVLSVCVCACVCICACTCEVFNRHEWRAWWMWMCIQHQAKRNQCSPVSLAPPQSSPQTPCTMDFMANFRQFILAVSEEIPAGIMCIICINHTDRVHISV